MLVDTHAHIHFEQFKDDLELIFENSDKSGVNSIITVGTDEQDSKRALEFIYNPDTQKIAQEIDLYATAGLHPHEASRGEDALLTIKELVEDGGYGKKLVAVGECGLDYYRNLSDQAQQLTALRFQIELAIEQGLPVVFHVRDAWDDFFKTLKDYPEIRGVIHSFTGTPIEVEKAANLNLYFGLNGIITFTNKAAQLEAAKLVPNDHLLLETDCPFLAPEPVRGKRNEPGNLKYIAEFLAKLRGQTVTELAEQTTNNAKTLFNI